MARVRTRRNWSWHVLVKDISFCRRSEVQRKINQLIADSTDTVKIKLTELDLETYPTDLKEPKSLDIQVESYVRKSISQKIILIKNILGSEKLKPIRIK